MSKKVPDSGVSAKFGYFPQHCQVEGEHFQIQTLPGFEEYCRSIEKSESRSNEWVYPSTGRIFGLPKTHALTLYNNESIAEIEFIVWCISFFNGIRLTTTQAGFLDATPITVGKLVDFVLINRSGMADIISISLSYIRGHRDNQKALKRVAAIIHALFLAQSPRNLPFEKFQYLYMALDCCYRLVFEGEVGINKDIPHSGRVEWMCKKFGMPVPHWANSSVATEKRLTDIRNDTFHEALFFGEPLGFALSSGNQLAGRPGNILLEMQALVCRLLVAILGKADTTYVKSPINTRQHIGLDLV